MAAKKDVNVSVFLEFNGKSVNVADVSKAAKENWKKGHKGDIKEFQLYLKSQESKAYYVVNGEDAGAVKI